MNAGNEVGKEMARAGESLSSAGVLLEKALPTDAPARAFDCRS